VYIEYIANSLKNQIFLPNFLSNSFTVIPKKMILIIGAWKREVEVIFKEDIRENTIGISKYVMKDFTLPESFDYEVKLEDRSIHIGPVIAFLVESKKHHITPKDFERLKDYYKFNKDNKGVIYVCTAEHINTSNATIEGFYYTAENESVEEKWNFCVFPYPDSMFKRRFVPQMTNDILIERLGDKIFNSYFFNKWEMWELLSPYQKVAEHLPYTEKLTDIVHLDKMLETYGSVYLKLARGYQSKGIVRVEKSDTTYHFTDILEGEKVIGEGRSAADFINELTGAKEGRTFYMMQQGVEVKRHRGRMFDLRVVMQKDESMKWGCSGIIARFGKKNGIATKISGGGYALKGNEALKKVFGLNDKETFLKQKEIINICLEACNILDKAAGNFGDLGFDVMLDEKGKVWILEINKSHDHRFPLYSVGDSKMYYEIITNPFKYAKSLGGF
jgi:hypothetical protein